MTGCVKRRLHIAALLLALCSGAHANAAGAFTPLGDLLGNDFASSAYAISADGEVIVGSGRSISGSEAFRWTESSGLVGLGDLPGSIVSSRANAVSRHGSVVVGSAEGASGGEAFRWTENGGMVGLGAQSSARAVSADGNVVVGIFPGAIEGEAFRWTEASGMVGLGELGGGARSGSEAYGVSADGSVVTGASWSAAGWQAFRWTESSGMVGIGDLPGGRFESIAYGVSADGSVIVGSGEINGGRRAFRWTVGTGMVALTEFHYSYALAASGDGSVIVGRHQGPFVDQDAFIWDEAHGMRSLTTVLANAGVLPNGWLLQEASGVSADGKRIVGWGRNPDGNTEAWLVDMTAIPEPSAVSLLAIGACASAVFLLRSQNLRVTRA
jgi:probable HAF family extracellular repeat protein